MARRSAARTIPRRFRRTKAFFAVNLLAWIALGVWYLSQPADRQADIARLVRNALDSRKEVTALDVAWDLWQLHARDDTVGAVAPGDRRHAYGGAPASARTVRVLSNTGYIVGYSDALGNPLWVAYRVRDIEAREAPARPEAFGVDVRTLARVEPAAYARSGYDRGHMAPSHAIATRYGSQAQEETFLMSNIAPQRHALNAGPWRRLEARIAGNYAARFGEVWVIVGPVFGARPPTLRGGVAVPESFYMVIVDEMEGGVRALAFVLPQAASDGPSLSDHLASIDAIEQRTGLDFLHELPDEAEAALEARRAARMW